MTYGEARKIIDKYIFQKFKHEIGHRVVSNDVRYSEGKKVLLNMLDGIDPDVLQQYFDAMYDEQLIRKDDGVTVYFTPDYIYSTANRSYFE